MGAARKIKAPKVSIPVVSTPVPTSIPATGLTFAVAKRDLRAAIQSLASVADRKSALPILANITIRTVASDPRHVVMTATDLNVSLKILVAATIVATGVGICVPAKALLDTVKSMPDGDITIGGANGGATIANGAARASLQGCHERDTPKFPDVPSDPKQGDEIQRRFTTVDATVIVEMLESVQHAICQDETRFHLNGTYLECTPDRTRAVATDGHRLAVAERDICMNALAACPELTKGVIIPRKGCAEIGKFLAKRETAEIAVKGHLLYVRRGDGALLVVKLIDAQFPPYEQVIPREHKRHAILDIEAMTGAVERARVHASDTRGVRLALATGKLTISGDNPDSGEYKEEIPCEYEGKDFTHGANARYLLDSLRRLTDGGDERVVISTDDQLDPMLVRGADDYAMTALRPERFLSVVMPMRI